MHCLSYTRTGGIRNRGGIPPEDLTRKMLLTGARMPEKSFAATHCSCRDAILDKHDIMYAVTDNCIMASGEVLLKLKDFEDIYVP